MAITEGLRINQLTTKLSLSQLASLYSTLRLVVDDPSFSGDTPYVLIEDLLKSINDLLTSQDARITNNYNDISAYKIFKANELDSLVDDIDWGYGTILSAKIETPESVFRTCKRGKAISLTGTIKLGSIPSENTPLFEFPSSFPNFTITHYFTSNDAALGRSDEAIELKALANTRTIVMGAGGSNGTTQYFNETFWL